MFVHSEARLLFLTVNVYTLYILVLLFSFLFSINDYLIGFNFQAMASHAERWCMVNCFFVFAQVVGLGNLSHPETHYSVGMLVVDTLAKYLGTYGHFNRQYLGYVAVTKVGHQELILLKPSVAMNLNGRSISKAGTLAVRLFLWHKFCGILNIGTGVGIN